MCCVAFVFLVVRAGSWLITDRVAPRRVPLHGCFRDGGCRRPRGAGWSLEAAPQGGAPCGHMRERNSARERAAAAGAATYARVPQLPGQCVDCRRWLSRERLCVVAVGADDYAVEICGLCSAVSMVQEGIRSAVLSDSEEEDAMAALHVAFTLIRQGRAGAQQPQ